MDTNLDLNLFGEGGDGGAGAAAAGAGESAAPADGAGDALLGNAPEALAQGDAQPVDKAAAFEALIKGEYKDEFAKRTQGIINSRFRAAKAAEEKSKAVEPVIAALYSKYGVDPASKDAIAQLQTAINEDDTYYEVEAARRGMSVDQLKEIRRVEGENAVYRAREAERERNQILSDWQMQADKLSQVYPNFALDAEISGENGETFLNLIRSGIDIKTAYEVIHKDELLSGAIGYAVTQAQQRTVDNIRARGLRPSENGAGNKNSGTQIRKSSPSTWSDAEYDDILRRVRSGEKINL